MNKPQTIFVSGFEGTFWVSRDCSFNEYERQVRKYLNVNVDTSNRNSCGLTTTFESEKCMVYWIWTRNKNIQILVHEAVHAVLSLFRNRGVSNIVEENEEFLAYYVDYIVGEVLEEEKRNKKRSRKKAKKAVKSKKG